MHSDPNTGIETTAAFSLLYLITVGFFFVDLLAVVAPQCLRNYEITNLKCKNNVDNNNNKKQSSIFSYNYGKKISDNSEITNQWPGN